LIFAGIVIVGILGCAFFLGPNGPGGPPNPTIVDTNPRPDFYFLAIFAALALLPDWMEVIVLFVAPVIAIGFLLALPFIAPTGEKSYRKRPVAVISVVFILTVIGVLAYMGVESPWSPPMGAWSGDAVPVQYVHHRTPLELHGAVVLQNKQCRNCHSLGGVGGQRGPALDDVASRLTSAEMVRQVVQGGGNMPAYGKKLSPAEIDAVVAFMRTLSAKSGNKVRESAPPLDVLPRDFAVITAGRQHK
jgi:ubiquinol-cytochrome c reductase cytochrome b subunit